MAAELNHLDTAVIQTMRTPPLVTARTQRNLLTVMMIPRPDLVTEDRRSRHTEMMTLQLVVDLVGRKSRLMEMTIQPPVVEDMVQATRSLTAMMKTPPPLALVTGLATQAEPPAGAEITRTAMGLGIPAAVPETQALETMTTPAAVMVDSKVADRAAAEAMTTKQRLARADMEDLEDEVETPIVTGRTTALAAAVMEASKVVAKEVVPTTTKRSA